VVVWICGTKVKILTGRHTQTVNFESQDGEVDYDPRVVIRPPNPRIGSMLQDRDFLSKEAAVEYLVQECRGVIDPPLQKYAHITTEASDAALSRNSQAEPEGNHMSTEWMERAVSAVERVLDQFVLQFIDFPYLHRVEHSIHCELYRLLSNERIFANTCPMNRWVSQSIHKEWPEYKPRPDKGNRRGNIDLCIIAPKKLVSCTYEQFRHGRIEPDIAIEIGLDYRIRHLKEDSRKLLNSSIGHGYLVHLVRQDVPDNYDAVEAFLLSHTLGNLKTGYAKLCGTQAAYKLVNDREIGRMRISPA
jgi:hypothetical protein